MWVSGTEGVKGGDIWGVCKNEDPIWREGVVIGVQRTQHLVVRNRVLGA